MQKNGMPHCHKEENGWAAAVGQPPRTNETKDQGTELEEKLILEKDMGMSTNLLASGLTDKMKEQNDKLEISACWSAKLEGCKLPQLKF